MKSDEEGEEQWSFEKRRRIYSRKHDIRQDRRRDEKRWEKEEEVDWVVGAPIKKEYF